MNDFPVTKPGCSSCLLGQFVLAGFSFLLLKSTRANFLSFPLASSCSYSAAATVAPGGMTTVSSLSTVQAGCRINCEIQSRMDGDGCKSCLSGGCCGFWLVLTSGGSCFAHGCLVRLAGVCENHLPLPSGFCSYVPKVLDLLQVRL